mmetsp:Transcript_32274/g.47205  ORF Transcript_32274/g.47205 Transcript_32274/m.47205 type:complete len:281 (+) Transcript_32274:20-862(+)
MRWCCIVLAMVLFSLLSSTCHCFLAKGARLSALPRGQNQNRVQGWIQRSSLTHSSKVLLAGSKGGSNVGESSSEVEEGSQVDESSFKILAERVAYSRWRKIIERDVELPNGTQCSFDIVHNDLEGSIVVFAWDTRAQTATLVREFQPGPMRLLHGVAAGMYEPNKHGSPLEAARMELEEEAHLTGGTWINMMDEGQTITVDKYNTNRVHCFLVLDPTPAPNPRALDAEEHIEIRPGATRGDIMGLITSGNMNIMSSYTCLLAFEKLRTLGLLNDENESCN